jgi:hypothetical protein
MTNSIVFTILLLLTVELTAQQVSGAFEKIYYFEPQGNFSMGPIATIKGKNNWYGELRYNYEMQQTFSAYIGKAYVHEGVFSYSIIPIFGGLLGLMRGGSGGLKLDADYKGFYFSSQSQYSFSVQREEENFYFSWSEAGYQPLTWLYGGVAMQPIYYPRLKQGSWSPGVVLGLTYKHWTIPLYVFEPFTERETFIISILYEWHSKK